MGARISAGRCVASITLAMVKVLPEPVTPSSTWSRSFARTPLTSSSIACGWSPSGSNSETTRNRRPPSDLSGRGGRWGVHGGRLRMLGSPSLEQRLQQFRARRRADQAVRMAVGRGALEFRLRRFAEPLRLGLDQGGIEQLREMLAERIDFGPRGLGLHVAGGFFGGGHGRNMGRVEGRGKGGNALAGIGLNLRLGGACSTDDPTESDAMSQASQRYHVFETAMGFCAIAWSDAGVARFQLPMKNAEPRNG